jgi:tyrosine-protein phosphatase YwqE
MFYNADLILLNILIDSCEINSKFTLSSMVATSHMGLFKFNLKLSQIKNSVIQLHYLSFKYSIDICIQQLS